MAALQIGNQRPAAYSDARLRALDLPVARMIVPWDAATSQPDKVAAWLTATAAAGMQPHIAFEHLSSDRCPNAPCTLPSRSTFRAAVAALRLRRVARLERHPGDLPGVDREHDDHHVVLDGGGDHVTQGTPGGPPARSRGAVLSDWGRPSGRP